VIDLSCFGASRVLVRSELKLGVGIVLLSVSSCDVPSHIQGWCWSCVLWSVHLVVEGYVWRM